MEALPQPRCVWPQAEKKSVEAEIEERPVETADENVSISGSLSSARPLPVLPTMNPVGGEKGGRHVASLWELFSVLFPRPSFHLL